MRKLSDQRTAGAHESLPRIRLAILEIIAEFRDLIQEARYLGWQGGGHDGVWGQRTVITTTRSGVFQPSHWL